MPTIGLTGNFGMGKTTVLHIFKKSGARVFSSDKFVHEILKKPATIKMIAGLLGEDVLIKRHSKLLLNRARIADIVFDDAGKRKALETIIHPQVLKMIKTTRSKILKKNPAMLIVFEIPLLFETGYNEFFDKTIVVYCNKHTAIKRLVRKGFSEDAAKKRLRAQMPVTEKKKLADFTINNSGDIHNTEKQVRRLLEKLQ